MKKYGLSPEDHDAMLIAQDGKCAICKKPPQLDGKRNRKVLQIDHDHKTNKVRALLCNNCNVLLGNAADDTAVLMNAVSYLEFHAQG